MKHLIAALKSLAGIEDTDYPYYHVSNHPETPTVRTDEGGRHKDPAGIYLFYKGKEVAQTDWKPKKYRWDAKIKTKITDLNDLDYDDLLAKVGIKGIYRHVESLKNTKTMDLESWKDMDYEPWLDSDEEFVWTDVGYPLLREHFNSQKEFAKFLLNQGIKVLVDTEGHTVFLGEPQLIVLDPSIIEWGPREENVADKKVYMMAAIKALAESEIDEVTAESICYWIENGANNAEAKEMIENLAKVNAIPAKYKKVPNKTLYRGVDLTKGDFGEGITTGYDSWTTSKDLAKSWGFGLTLAYKPRPQDVVVNINAIVPDLFKTYPDMECEYYNENEIILKPVKLTKKNILA